LVIVEKEAEIVTKIYAMALTLSPKEIAETFKEKPYCFRQTIINILSNDIYCGYIHLDKEKKKGKK